MLGALWQKELAYFCRRLVLMLRSCIRLRCLAANWSVSGLLVLICALFCNGTFQILSSLNCSSETWPGRPTQTMPARRQCGVANEWRQIEHSIPKLSRRRSELVKTITSTRNASTAGKSRKYATLNGARQWVLLKLYGAKDQVLLIDQIFVFCSTYTMVTQRRRCASQTVCWKYIKMIFRLYTNNIYKYKWNQAVSQMFLVVADELPIAFYVCGAPLDTGSTTSTGRKSPAHYYATPATFCFVMWIPGQCFW